jgi:hypothetical protein
MKELIDLLSYDKSIWLYPNGFCLLNGGSPVRQQFYRYRDGDILSVKAKEFFSLSSSEATDIEIVVANEPPIIVPKELFQEEDALKFADLQYDAGKISRSFSCDMEAYKLVYFLYQNEQNALDRLPLVKHYTSYWDLIHKHISKKQQAQNLIWVAEHELYLDMYVEKKGKAVLLNRFDYVTAEDKLYHILNVRHQCQLGDAHITIVSNIHRSPLKTLVKKYLDNYSWID